jgi:hypothetical protein
MRAPERKVTGSKRRAKRGWKIGPQWVLPDKGWLEHQYRTLQKSAVVIGSEVGVSSKTIRNWMKKLDISSRTIAEANLSKPRRCPHHSRSYLGKKAREVVDSAGIPKWCEICGKKSLWLVVHHKDENRENNELENLQRLCRRCHALVHNRCDFPEGVF